MDFRQSFGEYLKELRIQFKYPQRKVAAKLDIDPSTLSKIERGERWPKKESLPILSTLFMIPEEEFLAIYLMDRISNEMITIQNIDEIMESIKLRIKYLRDQNSQQGELNLNT